MGAPGHRQGGSRRVALHRAGGEGRLLRRSRSAARRVCSEPVRPRSAGPVGAEAERAPALVEVAGRGRAERAQERAGRRRRRRPRRRRQVGPAIGADGVFGGQLGRPPPRGRLPCVGGGTRTCRKVGAAGEAVRPRHHHGRRSEGGQVQGEAREDNPSHTALQPSEATAVALEKRGVDEGALPAAACGGGVSLRPDSKGPAERDSAAAPLRGGERARHDRPAPAEACPDAGQRVSGAEGHGLPRV
mmetsp:Transcript_94454/g.291189  ORF Transcript_94454/g.291189 Transcript_94454/m.291189 type:complete len:245 (-) Transcript_94454:233-967(-)